MIPNVASCTQDTKFCSAVITAAMNMKQKILFTSKLDTKLRNKLVKCNIWRTALWLCGAGSVEGRAEMLCCVVLEVWKVEQKCCVVWCWKCGR
jgi:hypothetical protein